MKGTGKDWIENAHVLFAAHWAFGIYQKYRLHCETLQLKKRKVFFFFRISFFHDIFSSLGSLVSFVSPSREQFQMCCIFKRRHQSWLVMMIERCKSLQDKDAVQHTVTPNQRSSLSRLLVKRLELTSRWCDTACSTPASVCYDKAKSNPASVGWWEKQIKHDFNRKNCRYWKWKIHF